MDVGLRGNDGLRFDLNLTDGDTWRDLTEYSRQSAPLRWGRTLGQGLQLRTDRSVTRRDGFAVDWTRQERIYDYDAVVRGISSYLQVALTPVEGLHITAGRRYDDVGFDYSARLASLQEGLHRRPADARVRYSNLGPSLRPPWTWRRS